MPTSLPPASEHKLKQFFQLGLQHGWSAVLQRFGDRAAGIKPTLFIHQRCKHLLECLPYLQHDPDRPADVLKTNINDEGVGGDDPADALRYMVATKTASRPAAETPGPLTRRACGPAHW